MGGRFLAIVLALFLVVPAFLRAGFTIPERPKGSICDPEKRFTPQELDRIEKALRDLHVRYGVRIHFLRCREPYDLPLREGDQFADAVARAWGLYGKDDVVVLTLGGIFLRAHVGPNLRDRVDFELITFLASKHVAPIGRTHGGKHDVATGVLRACGAIGKVFDGERPKGFLLWKFFEVKPFSPANGEVEGYLLIAFRYLFAVLCTVPLILAYLFVVTRLARRLDLSLARLPLLELPVMALLVAFAFGAAYVDLGTWNVCKPLVVGSGLVFLFSTPLHMLLGRKFLCEDGWPAWVFVLLYVIFPLAVFAAGAALKGMRFGTQLKYREGHGRGGAEAGASSADGGPPQVEAGEF